MDKYVQREDYSYLLMNQIIFLANQVRPHKVSEITSKDVHKYMCPGLWKQAGKQFVLKGYFIINDKKKIL